MIRHKIKRVTVSIVTTLFLSLIIGMMYLKYNQTRLETQKKLPQKWHLNGFSNAGLSNDTQTILKNNGQYELFYLVDSGKGLQSTKQRTRWSKSISSDLVNFQLKDDVNIKPVSNHESVATGSIVKDVEDIAGYGKNTLLAYATKYIDGNQWTYMWYSNDRGKRWKIANKGQPVAKPYKIGKAFRDPNVFYDSEQQQFVMTMAEADDDDHMKIGFYTSKNGISWKYTDSYYSPRNLGTLEVPEIHQVYQKNTGKKEWVLFFGANGFADDYQQSSGTYYVVGKLENGRFQSSSSPQRVDFGTDYYAAHHYQETASELLGFGWMGNWDYINAVSNDITYKGNYSAFRKIFLDSENRLKTSKVMTENIFDTKKKAPLLRNIIKRRWKSIRLLIKSIQLFTETKL
ncbi:glycoside hydrolase family 32 protein [Leuconostoc litchii]|uniref:glycoside hydrolase family 32 protein n=1 Tax=Leuconostoc litchii TaxID=1981069 RepID=UPI0024E0C332|nr:glycoside hydrolase family 32 protein [Leuconostoc litchii]